MPKVEQYKFAIHQIIVPIRCLLETVTMASELLGKKKAETEPMEQMEPMETMDTLEFHLLMLVVISHELALNKVQAPHLLHRILKVREVRGDTMDILLFQRWMTMAIFHGVKNM